MSQSVIEVRGEGGTRMYWDSQFTLFVREHSDGLYRSACLLVGDRGAAADLVQETLVQLYPKWDKVLAADSPVAYVRRSMTNRFVADHRRRRSQEITLADLPEHGSTDGDPARVLDRVMLAAPLASLSARQRAALVLRYYDDLSEREAAAALRCPVPTLRSHVRRGLAALRAQLDGATPSQAARTAVLRRSR